MPCPDPGSMPLAAGPAEQEMVYRQGGVKAGGADFAPSAPGGDVGLCPVTAPGWQSVPQVGREGRRAQSRLQNAQP